MLESQAQHIEALQRCDDVSPPYSLVADAQLMHCVELGWAASSGFAQRRTLRFLSFQLFTHSDIQALAVSRCFAAASRECSSLGAAAAPASCSTERRYAADGWRYQGQDGLHAHPGLSTCGPDSDKPALPIRASRHHPLSRETLLFGTLWPEQTSAAALARSLHTLR